jgi:hypothetical protein
MPQIAGTSRARRVVVEPIPSQHDTGPEEPPTSPAPVKDSEVPQPEDAIPDLDAAATGMSMLLRCALRLMKSYD